MINILLLLAALFACENLFAQEPWKDRSSHVDSMIRVNGVELEYLEWGKNQKRTVLLLAGLGNSAHIYDDFAPKLADKFRVIAPNSARAWQVREADYLFIKNQDRIVQEVRKFLN
jgi:hypothetical protein